MLPRSPCGSGLVGWGLNRMRLDSHRIRRGGMRAEGNDGAQPPAAIARRRTRGSRINNSP
jgi:hypothetical protein